MRRCTCEFEWANAITWGAREHLVPQRVSVLVVTDPDCPVHGTEPTVLRCDSTSTAR